MAGVPGQTRRLFGFRTTTRRPRYVALGVVLVALSALAAGAAAAPAESLGEAAQQQRFTATPLAPVSRVEGAKSASGRLAQTDESLLGLRSDAPINVVVKLDYDAVASYAGQIDGLPATSPSETGKPLNMESNAAQSYLDYVRDIEQRFLARLDTRVPEADVGRLLRVAYGGVALSVPGNEVAELLKLPGVVAVQDDSPEQTLTDSSPAFIGAPTIYGQLGGSPNDAGKGTIVGVLDTGAWPEHPSFADPGSLPAPPPTADGTPRVCNFGDNPLTPANDPFVCQNKLISGRAFLATYNAVFGGEVYPTTARDSNGHGSHTASTSAGGPVANANPLGINRGPIRGVAPGAHVAVYKNCGEQGCFPSDSAAAVARAILDRVDVINYSIAGGEDPFADPVELAFLDAYAAGVFVSASAGNDGPGAATNDHNSPWVTTVAASTQERTFRSTITLSSGATTLQIAGATITSGIGSPLPVVRASAPPYNNVGCTAPAPPGLFTGKIVACERGPNRILRGFNVRQGGAVGMILYNATPLDVMTDNHWLPTVHIDAPESQQLLAFLAANPGATASFPQGSATTWQGDRVTYFSSRGPGTDWLKPDVTAPGLHILAGNTPTPATPAGGPPGNLYQAIAGTSMSAPHVTGSAALIAALHPTWSPGQIKSALETTAKFAGVTKSDGVAPADPFDVGGGRIDLTKAGDPGVTFDETAANYVASEGTPLTRIDLNTPSVNAPRMPGEVTTTRTARNVTNQTLNFRTSAVSSPGTSIEVHPKTLHVLAGGQATLQITISAPEAAAGQYFGRIDLEQTNGTRKLHLPVAFFRRQGDVTLTQTCTPSTIVVQTGRSTCDVSVHNPTLSAADVDLVSTTSQNLKVTDVTSPAAQAGPRKVKASTTIPGRRPDAPTIAPGSLAGYIPLNLFGVTPIPIGDEAALNFTVPAFRFAGETFTRLGVTSNGYMVAGGAVAQDVSFLPQTLPDPARPNAVLAPFWTDLNGTGAPGIFATVLTDGVSNWVVIEWRVNVFGTSSLRVFQAWIGINGTEDITFAYDPANLPAAPPPGYGLTVGAENREGVGGAQTAPTLPGTPPTQDLRVTSTPGAPGGTFTYSFGVRGIATGLGWVRTDLTTPLVRGTTIDVDAIQITN